MMSAELDADLTSLRQVVSAVGGAVELDSDESDAQLAADSGDDNASVTTEVVVSSHTRRGVLAARRAGDSWMDGGADWRDWSERRWS